MPLPFLASIPLALTLTLTRASAGDEPFTFEFASQTDQNGTAYVVIHARQNASGVRVTIEGDDGTSVARSLSMRGGTSKKITWRQQGKETHYRMSIKAGDADTDFEFDTRKARAGGKPGLSMIATREELVDQHKVKYKTSFVVSNYKFQVYNTGGDVIEEIEKDDVDHDIGDVIELSWNSPDELFMVYFRAGDDVGRFAEDRRVPWGVTIPHTEVNFDSGKWDIKPNEAPKVDDAFAVLVHELDGLERANAALGPDFKDKITASLYIVGYTDTVGNAGDNQVLSINRARAIAQYFKEKGAWCSIYYNGMGERGLAVETPDSTDEIRNRRALYLLMPDPQKPGATAKIPGSWKKLTDATPRTMAQLPELPDSYLEFKRKQQDERERKFGSGEGGTSGGDDGDDNGDYEDPWGTVDFDAERGDDGGPSPIEGDDAGSATGKGCSLAPRDSGAPGTLALAVLLGLVGWRRRSRA